MKYITRITIILLLLLTSLTQAQFHPVSAATNTIAITAAVNAKPTDVEISLSQNKSGTLIQDDEIIYTIKYRSLLPQPIAFTIEADWGKGIIDGATTPSVDGLDYVLGSAGIAYGNTHAIISTLHSTISWNIPQFSSTQGEQSVSFTLRLNDNYRSTHPVTFPVNARIMVPVASLDASVMTPYKYKEPAPTTTPSPTPESTATTASPTPVPSPSAAPLPLNVKREIELREINPTGAVIQYQGLSPGSVTARYGKSPSSMTQKTSSLSETGLFLISLSDLSEGTDYYAQIIDATTTPFTSDIYQFHTSTQKAFSEIFESSSLVMNTQGVMLYNGSLQTTSNATSEYPAMSTSTDNALDLSIAVKNPELVRSIQIFIRDPLVLGASSDELLQTGQGMLTAVSDKLYTGKLRAPGRPGKYDVISRVEDIYGNIVEQKIADFFAMPPLLITNARTKKPIENARVTFSLFDPRTKLYSIVPNTSSSLQNPAYSDVTGKVALHVSPGTYRLLIQATGYEDQTVEIAIETTTVPVIPEIALKPLPFSVGLMMQKQQNALGPFVPMFQQFILSITKTQEIFSFIFFICFFFIVGCIIYGFSIRFQVRPRDLPVLLTTIVKAIRIPDAYQTIQGTILLPNGTACRDGNVCIQATGSNQPTLCTHTDHLGKFVLRNISKAASYRILILDKQDIELFSKVIEATEIAAPIVITLHVAPEGNLARILVLVRVLLRMAGSFFLELFLFMAGCCAILSWFIYAPFYAAISSLVVLVALVAWVFDIYLTRQFAVRDIIRLR